MLAIRDSVLLLLKLRLIHARFSCSISATGKNDPLLNGLTKVQIQTVVLVGTSRKVLDDGYQSLLNIFRTDHTNKIQKHQNPLQPVSPFGSSGG